MNPTLRWTVAAVSSLTLVAVVGWLLLFGGRDPDPVSLDDAVAGVTTTTTSEVEAPNESAASASLDGAWTIGPGSFVGYRVVEELANVGANTAVGRTESVVGSMQIAGTMITAVDVEADLRDLQSDEARRDRALANRGLESATFPLATFTLTEPIQLPELPVDGVPIVAGAVGELTIHGVTRPVEVPIEAQRSGSTITVIGSLDVLITDFDIDPPTGFAVLSIDENAVMELQLRFGRE